MEVFIYTLTDPETNQIRYIGKSDNLERRLWQHEAPSFLKDGTHKSNWIKNLHKRGLSPRLEVIETCDEHNWEEREKHWIFYARDFGCTLTNATAGGDGGFGRIKSEEERAKLSAAMTGRKLTKETVEKIAAKLRGRKASEETKEKLRLAQKARRSKERSEFGKCDNGHVGYLVKPQQKEKMSKSWTPERRAALSEKMKGNKFGELSWSKRTPAV